MDTKNDRLGDDRLLIDGHLRPASGDKTFDNIDPTTEQVIGVAADASVNDAAAAVQAARRAFDDTDWAHDVDARIQVLEQMKDAVAAHSDELRRVLVEEAGCPLSFTRSVQLDLAFDQFDEAAALAQSYQWEQDLPTPAGTDRAILRREPRGVVSAITPFNYPLYLNLRKTVHALAAGCTVVLKPSPETPWSAAVLGRIVAEATDMPPGVFNVVTSRSIDVARHLTADPDVDMVTFVGSSAVGRQIGHQAADGLKKLVLELGGKSASIILDDADVAAAARVAAGVGLHAGQGCGRLTRFLVPRSRYDEAIDAAVDAFSQIVVGDPRDEATIQGPQVSKHQHERVLGLVAQAKADGARVAFGGTGVPDGFDRGYFVEPTLFVDVDPDSAIAQTEVFGPVAVMTPFDTDDEAVAIANNSAYGLSGAVTSGDLDRALTVARRVRTGQVIVNGGRPAMDTPFGGWKQSGIGVDSGVLGFEEHLEAKVMGVPA